MFVPTKASLLRGDVKNNHTSIAFTRKRKAVSETKNDAMKLNLLDKEKNKKREVVPDMKKLRYEIIKFGTSGLEGHRKEEANVALMMSLGARAPPKKGKNYKELLAEKKQFQKQQMNETGEKTIKESRKFDGKRKLRSNRKKGISGLLNVYGEVSKQQKFTKKKR